MFVVQPREACFVMLIGFCTSLFKCSHIAVHRSQKLVLAVRAGCCFVDVVAVPSREKKQQIEEICELNFLF